MENIPITDEIILMFKENPTALIIWADIMLKINKNRSFIPRRSAIKEKFNLGNVRMNKTINFLKAHGLAETFPIYKKGRMTGAGYKFYSFENAVKNPSPTTSPGPQAKTRVIAETKPGTPLNGANTECLKNEHSEIIKGEKLNLIPFENSNPDAHKKCFLDHFKGHNTYQVFDDSPNERRHLSKIYQIYNPLELDAKNSQGAGVFITVNETDGKGRAKANIKKVRAVFADLDGAPLLPVLEYCPSMVVESSPGRYHVYWVTDDTPLESFSKIQKAIAVKFGSDQEVTDRPRCMRIPGYYHCKSELVLSQILYTSTRGKYSFDELQEMFLNTPKQNNNHTFKIHGAHKGERNAQLCKLVGAMKKRDFDADVIKEKAYTFAEACTPPLPKYAVNSVLRAATQWNSGNEEMQGKKNAAQ